MTPSTLIPLTIALLCLPLALARQPAHAAERVLTLDAETSAIRFTLGATLHQVEGTVRLVSGRIRFDPSGGPAAGEIVVDALSADTGNEGRDQDMHGKVLETDRFGAFVLRPTETVGEVDLAGTSEIELRGELEIHGGVHPVSLPTEVTLDGDRVTGRATLTVPYVDWGMKNPSKLFLRVKRFVEVEIDLAGTLATAG